MNQQVLGRNRPRLRCGLEHPSVKAKPRCANEKAADRKRWPRPSEVVVDQAGGRVEKRRDRGKAEMVILCAFMRKLLHVVFGVLKNQKPYDPSFHAHA